MHADKHKDYASSWKKRRHWLFLILEHKFVCVFVLLFFSLLISVVLGDFFFYLVLGFFEYSFFFLLHFFFFLVSFFVCELNCPSLMLSLLLFQPEQLTLGQLCAAVLNTLLVCKWLISYLLSLEVCALAFLAMAPVSPLSISEDFSTDEKKCGNGACFPRWISLALICVTSGFTGL